MTHHRLLFLSPHLLNHPFATWASIAKEPLTHTHLLSRQPQCPCLSHPASKCSAEGKVKRGDTRVMFHLAGYPEFSLLDQSHLRLTRQCDRDTVASIHVHVTFKSGLRETTKHTHSKNTHSMCNEKKRSKQFKFQN